MLAFRGRKPRRRGLRASLLAGATLVALAIGGFGAGSASAAIECTGNNITGAGSTLQKVAQTEVWKPGFETEICPGGPTITYNAVGSGSGLKEWNSDGKKGSINTGLTFIGTDDAPSEEQIANITSVAGGASLLTVPVAQTAISIVANPPAECEIEAITNIDLEAVFRGVYLTWSKIPTASGPGCSSPITRVVRKDGSGTTYQFKNYLAKMNKSGLPCTTGGTEGKASWRELEPITDATTGAPNTTWPETCVSKTLSTVVRPAANGGGELVKTVKATSGSIGYAGLPDAKANAAPVILAVQNNGQKVEGATFAEPAEAGGVANCSQASYEVPKDARKGVGTALNVDWSKVFGGNPGIGGTAYPICTLTYALAFHAYKSAGYKNKDFATTRSYLREYIVQSTGQTTLENSGTFYAQLPTSSKAFLDVLGAAQYTVTKMTFE
jgi:ABC-type phosphate transport system substrate-binding protein